MQNQRTMVASSADTTGLHHHPHHAQYHLGHHADQHRQLPPPPQYDANCSFDVIDVTSHIGVAATETTLRPLSPAVTRRSPAVSSSSPSPFHTDSDPLVARRRTSNDGRPAGGGVGAGLSCYRQRVDGGSETVLYGGGGVLQGGLPVISVEILPGNDRAQSTSLYPNVDNSADDADNHRDEAVYGQNSSSSSYSGCHASSQQTPSASTGLRQHIL